LRIKTAVLEIVRNALEATAAGGNVRIILRAAPQPPGNHARQPIQWVSMTVTDDGDGVPAEMTEKIFQPFFTTKKKQNAAGLGLTVALGFVQQAGGVLRFESKPGKTAFQMLLPSRGETM
jgi:nitrogen-specific signal transduction histidine kinase